MRRFHRQGYFGKNLREIITKGHESASTAQFTSEWSKSPTFFWHKKESPFVWQKIALICFPYYIGDKLPEKNEVYHYTRKDIPPPSWTAKLKAAFTIGDHIFYSGY